MKGFSQILYTLILTASIATILSLLPKNDSIFKQTNRNSTIHISHTPITLRDDNLVDIMADLPLHLQIKHVKLNRSILSVDFLINSNKVSKEIVYEDLYTVAQVFLAQTNNIDLLFVRVIDEQNIDNQGNNSLFLAMDASKQNLQAAASLPSNNNPINKKMYLLSHFHFVFTSLWNEWYGVQVNSK